MLRSVLPVAILLVFGLSACGGGAEVRPDPVEGAFGGVMDGAPAWVHDCNAHEEAEGMLCGVGIVQGTRNISLARSTAQSRGRAEIANTIESHIEAMEEDYQATTTGGDLYGVAADDEQAIVQVRRQLTDRTLNGARQADQWVSEDGSSFFALMVLDPERLHEAVQALEALPPEIREQVEESSRRAFERMDDQLESR